MRHGLTAAQWAYVRRASRSGASNDEETAGELNVVPFLDIVTNVMMFLLATIATAFTANIPIRADAACTHCTERPAATQVTIQVLPEGYLVALDGGFVQPACARTGTAAVTIPLRAGRHDPAALSRCLLALRENPAYHEGLARQRGVQVSSRGELPYGVLIETLDATRESRPGAHDLFPDPQLGVLR